ncbi:MAG: asparagine synthase (glutamine-hydrolyzing) [Chromatiaceae bacterium]|nr:MAG: asparagine synthase (glutamine-hydrolyzing) [Chromatiaceae bacterium]
MCGIAGVLLRDGARADPGLLARMAAALAHRGPDDRGVWCQGPVGLAQTRLSIIGLDSGHQPMLSAAGDLALVANGEVYNYLELNAALARQGCVPRTGSDSEVILNAYAHYGLGFLTALRGMYAFALYDARAGRLILGRDRLGIKPLFYTRLPQGIAFASELKALLPALPGAPEIDPAALRQFLQHQFVAGAGSILQGIQRVPPGTALIIDRRLRSELRRYWSALDVQPRQLTAAEALEELDALLGQVMREHLRADVPFGLFLSGGLDSAVLAALLASHEAGRIQAFSVGYADERSDELTAAAGVAAHLGLQHRPLRLDLRQVMARLPLTVWAADELMRDYACLPTAVLAETAAAGLKVVFCGEGGDEVFAGYGRYRPPPLERWFKTLRHPGSGGFRTRGQWPRGWVRRLFGPDLRRVQEADRTPFVAAWRATPRDWSDLQRRQYTDLVTALPDNLLVKTDRMLMAFGLEGRVPFLDHRLLEFGLALPDRLKVVPADRAAGTPAAGKWLLRQWVATRLPPAHLRRPKQGFHVPVDVWLQGDVALRVGAALGRNQGIRHWFRAAAIPALARARGAGRGNARVLFGLLQFAIWHRLFIEQPGRRPGPQEDPLEWIASD